MLPIVKIEQMVPTDPHGEILIAIQKSLTNTFVQLETDREILAIDVINKFQRKFKIIAAYRPGWYPQTLNDDFLSTITRLSSNQENFCLFGDFNLPDIRWNSFSASSDVENNFKIISWNISWFNT